MAHIKTSAVQQKREEVRAALLYAAGFHCLEEEWHDCEEHKPKPKEKLIFVDEKGAAKKKHRME